MYPVGWCFLAKHRLEAPKSAVKPLPVKGPKKRGRKKIKVEEGDGEKSCWLLLTDDRLILWRFQALPRRLLEAITRERARAA